MTLEQTSYTYDGKAKKPKVKSMKLNGKPLKASTDYTVAYKDNTKVGTATVTVKGKSNYKDSAKATFTIELGNAKLSTVASTKAKAMKTKWTKVAGAKSYQLQWRERGGKWRMATIWSWGIGCKPGYTLSDTIGASAQPLHIKVRSRLD